MHIFENNGKTFFWFLHFFLFFFLVSKKRKQRLIKYLFYLLYFIIVPIKSRLKSELDNEINYFTEKVKDAFTPQSENILVTVAKNASPVLGCFRQTRFKSLGWIARSAARWVYAPLRVPLCWLIPHMSAARH